MKKTIYLFGLLLLVAACNTKKGIPEEFDYGKIENHVYRNSYFDFRITLPESWTVKSQEEMAALQKQGQDLVAGDNSTLKKTIKASEVNTATLLMTTKYPGQDQPDNPNFIAVAERLSSLAKAANHIDNGKDYLEATKKLMAQSAMKFEQEGDIVKSDLSGQEFYKMTMKLDAGIAVLHQDYYATIINDFALAFVVTYVSDASKEELQGILNTIKFGDAAGDKPEPVKS
ncbi:MAG: lipoprotein [Chitinophagales bacterium]